MLIRTARGEGRVFNFRETAPESAHQDMYKINPKFSKISGTSIAIPGELRGFYDAHTRFGRLPWARLFEANIRLAEEGFSVTRQLHQMIEKFKSQFHRSKAMRDTYLNTDGTPKVEGDRILRPALGKTLREISIHGADVFYSGPLADAMVAEINRQGGAVTKEDFAEYRSVEEEPVHGHYRGYNVYSVGAPASGAVIIEALNILSGFDLRKIGSEDKTRVVHLIVEAMKFAYASRMKLGDPEFVDIKKDIERMLSVRGGEELKKKISLERTHEPTYYIDSFSDVHDHGTTHVSILDSDGMAVSSTCTVNLEFGSKIMDETTGVIFNNEMDDFSIPGLPNQFSIPPSTNNYAGPKRRPVSSSTPIIIEKDGRVVMIAGGTGGSRIISSTLLAIIRMIDLDQNPRETVLAPRYHHQLIPNFLVVEHHIDDTIRRGLEGLGHNVHLLGEKLYFSSIQLIKRDPISGIIRAAADPRKAGGTSGF